jgi:hypothetical protein
LNAELNYRTEIATGDAETDALVIAYPLDAILMRLADLPASSLHEVIAKIKRSRSTFEEGGTAAEIKGALLESAITDLHRFARPDNSKTA